ncbi:unnamed protein product [Zymoseptoria tritici ST99CH_1A5]|uniref:Uncharacterized protein n=1 Tax=Zymoseptoria tritici ST99CH_1A5 TaxID=1276529 RepID=A0A1Y6M1S3_ZYMTR|nr:unnamed protein product [Zymoseptoria tritici ST99CH_1A5]
MAVVYGGSGTGGDDDPDRRRLPPNPPPPPPPPDLPEDEYDIGFRKCRKCGQNKTLAHFRYGKGQHSFVRDCFACRNIIADAEGNVSLANRPSVSNRGRTAARKGLPSVEAIVRAECSLQQTLGPPHYDLSAGRGQQLAPNPLTRQTSGSTGFAPGPLVGSKRTALDLVGPSKLRRRGAEAAY